MATTTNAPPPKAQRHTCATCRLQAPPPIVIVVAHTARCTNQKACARRVRRLPKAKKAAT